MHDFTRYPQTTMLRGATSVPDCVFPLIDRVLFLSPFNHHAHSFPHLRCFPLSSTSKQAAQAVSGAF